LRDIKALRDVLVALPTVAPVNDSANRLIHAAAKAGHVDVIEELLNSGADPNMPEGDRIEDEDRILYQPGYVPLHYAARAGHKKAIDFLLARGAVPTAEDYWGGTPLHAARTAEIAEALLKAGANPNADCSLRHFDETLNWHFVASPLHVAAQCGNVPVIRVLVNYGANVDGTDGITGRTPLYYAAARGQVDAVKILLKFGADPNSSGKESGYGCFIPYTPLHRAVQKGHKEVVIALLKAGADATIKGGPDSKTAIEMASESRNHGIATALTANATKKRRTGTVREKQRSKL
jgi:hypothetical protein